MFQLILSKGTGQRCQMSHFSETGHRDKSNWLKTTFVQSDLIENETTFWS